MFERVRLRQKQLAAATEVRDWFALAKNAGLLQAEQRWLQQRLERCFGSYLLEYNAIADACWQTPVRHHIKLGDSRLEQDIYCSGRWWPVQPDGADAVILQHSLEFACSPYDLLREAARAVRPGGYLLLIGSNPWWPGYMRQRVWRHSYGLTAGRVAEWLAVLGFAQEPPLFAHYLSARRRGGACWLDAYLMKKQWPLGACYMIAARKQVHAAPLQRQNGRRMQELLPMPVSRQAVKPDIVKEQRKHD